jgi:hypothetical protein
VYQYRRRAIWTFTLKYCSFFFENFSFLSIILFFFDIWKSKFFFLKSIGSLNKESAWSCPYEYKACIYLYHRRKNQLVCSSLNWDIQFLLRLRYLWTTLYFNRILILSIMSSSILLYIKMFEISFLSLSSWKS